MGVTYSGCCRRKERSRRASQRHFNDQEERCSGPGAGRQLWRQRQGEALGNHCWESLLEWEGDANLGSDFISMSFHISVPSFSHLEFGHNVNLPASLGCFVRFGDSERNQHS